MMIIIVVMFCWALESRKSKAAWNVTPGAREPGMFSSIFSLR